MAILDKFEVQVYVDDALAQEFDDEDTVSDDPREVIKYIEAVSGDYFKFKFFADTSYQFINEDAVCFDIEIDGNPMPGNFFDREHFRSSQAQGRRCELTTKGRDSVDSDGPKLYKFQFADLETSMFSPVRHEYR